MTPWRINEISDMLDNLERQKEEEERWIIYVADKEKDSCEQCLNHNGKRFKESDLSRPALPIHPNCRCKYESLDSDSSKRTTMRSATVRTQKSPGLGGIRVSGVDDMLDKLEKQFIPGTLSELIITGHGDVPGQFEMGDRSRLENLTAEQVARLRRLLSSDAIVDIRMCSGIKTKESEAVAQNLADMLGCRVRAYAHQVSPLGIRPAFPKNDDIPIWERPFVGTGAKIFYPQK